MGDNTTALPVLGSLLLVLEAVTRGSGSDRSRAFSARAWPVLAAGALAGLATGLKLTNAPYALILCASLFLVPITMPRRAGLAMLFAAGALAGFAVTGGWWMLRMWEAFGNPLFPQFGSLFPNALAAPISVADRAWVPQSWWQHLGWPFLISFDARRAGHLGFRQVIWALAYAAFLSWALAAGWRRGRASDRAPLAPGARIVLFLVAAGFVAWMELFGVYRYLVPIELLAPLAIFLVAAARWPMRKAVRASRGLLVIATFVALTGMKTWGHGGWSDPLLHVDLPPLAEPARTTVLLAGGEPPWAWLAVGFPREVAFAQVGGNFPEGPRFRAALAERIAARGGPVFAIVTGHHDARVDEGKPAKRDIPAENRAEREKAARLLAAYGFALRPESCREHRAGIGREVQVYQWCPLV
jgi:hypothetical protein